MLCQMALAMNGKIKKYLRVYCNSHFSKRSSNAKNVIWALMNSYISSNNHGYKLLYLNGDITIQFVFITFDLVRDGKQICNYKETVAEVRQYY